MQIRIISKYINEVVSWKYISSFPHFISVQKRESDEVLEIHCVIDAPMDIEELQNHPRRNIFRQVRNEGIKINDDIVRKEYTSLSQVWSIYIVLYLTVILLLYGVPYVHVNWCKHRIFSCSHTSIDGRWIIWKWIFLVWYVNNLQTIIHIFIFYFFNSKKTLHD